MKILIVTSNYPRWVNDTTTPFVHNFARELVNNGHQVRVLAPHFSGAKIKETFEGVEVRRFRYLLPLRSQTVCYQGGALGNLDKKPFEKLKLPILVMCELLAVMKELVLWKPHVVNSHWLLPQGFVSALACKLFNTDHISTVHGGDVFALNSPFMKKLKAFTINNSALVTVNSSVTEKVTRELAPETNTYFIRLPTGILPLPIIDRDRVNELRKNLIKKQDEKLILFVGRLSEEKGIREAIHATHLLLQDNKQVRLIIVGEGHEKETFQALVAELNVDKQVDFLGWIPNQEVYTYFAACDVFVGPSKKAKNGQVEAQGLTFVEAMLAGCPVIGSNSGGIVDAVMPMKTGWLCEPADIDSLLEQLKIVLFSDSKQIEPITENAKQFSKATFLVSNVVQQFESALIQQKIGIY